MKNIIILLLTFSSITSFSQSKQDEIIGTWLSEDKEGKTEVYKKNGKYFGKLTWLKTPNDKNGKPFTDSENPNPKLRSTPLLNITIISSLEYNGKEWTNGKIYDPESGKNYSCTVWIENGKLKVRGYWGWFYETQTWTLSK